MCIKCSIVSMASLSCLSPLVRKISVTAVQLGEHIAVEFAELGQGDCRMQLPRLCNCMQQSASSTYQL